MSSKTLMKKVSLPYAEALLELGENSNTLDKMTEDVNMIKQVSDESNSFSAFISNPLISQNSKKEIIKQLFSGQVNDNLLTFLLILVERKRIAYLDSILEKYLDLICALESLVVANITSASSLSDNQQEALTKKLKSMTGNEQVKLEIVIDSNLIGGFIVQIGSKVIDTSLRGQLREIGYFLQVGKI
uniref:ATP synthase CF1 delta subunit n=1 Tax=Acrochaetium secundatum TaxID=209631 RepID=A0A4D6BMN1_9FLOR|nr:ATP synthase CF1 delta subunit [Acrochaetium secundatum]QBX88468.1 ATP synthase CF1 delta subunit [Acrochaetium secundatum]